MTLNSGTKAHEDTKEMAMQTNTTTDEADGVAPHALIVGAGLLDPNPHGIHEADRRQALQVCSLLKALRMSVTLAVKVKAGTPLANTSGIQAGIPFTIFEARPKVIQARDWSMALH